MKKLKLFLPALLLGLLANSQLQQIKIVSFTVKNQLPASIDSWVSTPGALIMVAQKVPSPIALRGIRLMVQIKAGGAVICGNNASTARPVDPFDVRTFNTADITGILTNCHELKEGTYSICVQFFNIDKVAISQEVCKDFRVEATNIEYSPPTLITPDNGKKFTAQELQGVVMFRWTPLVPKPKEPVTYRLKVWQLMQGQNGTQAMRTNQPIVTKDVDNITQAAANGIYTGPCRPPYLCDFIWQVQALNHSGKPMGNNNGNSEPYTFGVAEEKSKGPDNLFPEDKKIFTLAEVKKPLTFKWRPISPTPPQPVTYRLKVWQLMQGQSISNAINSTKPILDIDGNGQVDALTDGLLRYMETGPCKPPYLCDFVWNVEASIRQPGAAPKVIGTSEPTTFSVNESNNLVTIKNVFPEDNKSLEFELFFDTFEEKGDVKKPLTFTWTPITPKPQEPVTYRLKVWQLMQGQNGTQAMRTNQPIVTKDVDNLTEAAVSNIYTGPCKPPYLCDFVWNVEASISQAGAAPKIIGTSELTTFSIAKETGKCPANLFPEDKKKFTSEEAKKEMTFRWTPNGPPPASAHYRMKVWQLMQGQSGSQAMKTNQPIVTKDVDNITSATVSGIWTGPCRPPYLCDYIWTVEVVGAAGQTGCSSEPSTFSITEENTKCAANLFPEDKKKFTSEEAKREMTFRWTPNGPQGSGHYRMKVWQLMQGQSGAQAMRTNQPIVTKDVDNLTQVSVSGIYTGPCRPPYLCDFIWTVEMMGAAGQTGCTSEPTTFSVTEENVKCPANLFPEDKKKFTSEEAKREMLFRWTPVVPKPQEPVTYRMKVWQLMQGQSGSQAMKTNKPIVTKDVMDITEATVSGIYTGPCRPPYLCDYIWTVEVMGAAGQTGCTSEPTTFSVTEENVKCPSNLFPEDKKKFTSEEAKREMTFRWTANGPAPASAHYRMKVWQLMQGQSGTQAMRTNQPIVVKDVDNITSATVSGIYTGPCRPPYLCDFIWTVEVMGAAGQTGCTSEPTTFSVTEENIKCPANLFPEDKKKFTSEEAKKEMTFRWSLNGPAPASGHYRMKVWQLMQGQSGAQAMRTNQPIVTKDVDNLTQATVSGIYTGPCRPPYLCDFIWTVEVMGAAGQTGCSSEPTTFSVTEENVKCPANLFPEDKKKFTPEDAKKEMLFRWTALVPKPQEPVTYRMKVWQLMQGQSGSQAMRTNQPIVTKDVDNLTQATVSGIYTGPCKPPYLCDFIWMVEAVSKDGHTSCAGEPTTFSVTEENVKCPANLFPEDKKKFKSEEIKESVTFRWTPVTPTPAEPVTYRMKVWQLMQGQSGSQAMKTNKPIVTKDVMDLTEATVSGIYTGPCRPPYLCDFVWQVQAVDRQGKPIGENECKSEMWSFAVQNNIDIQIDSVKVGCCEKGKQSIYLKVKNNLASSVNIITVKYKINGAGAAINLTPITPSLTQLLPGNGTIVFTSSIDCIEGLNFLKFLVYAEDVADPDNNETEVKSDTLNCMCNVCKDIKIEVTEKDKPAVTPTGITQNLNIVTGPGKVLSVKADLVWFEFVPESDDCLVCTTPSSQMGNFSGGTLGGNSGNGSGTHGLSWNFSPPKNMTGGSPLQYTISFPKMVACCGGKAKWCIRYTVTYESCVTCSVVICNYEAVVKGCNK